MTTDRALLRLTKAAAHMDVHPDTLRRWAREGRVSCERLGSRGDLRFRREDLDALLHTRQVRTDGEGQ